MIHKKTQKVHMFGAKLFKIGSVIRTLDLGDIRVRIYLIKTAI